MNNLDEIINVDIHSIYSLKGLNIKVIPIDFDGNEGDLSTNPPII